MSVSPLFFCHGKQTACFLEPMLIGENVAASESLVMAMDSAVKISVLPVIAPGDQGYIDFKRWIEVAFPNISSAEYTQLCRWAAEMAEV